MITGIAIQDKDESQDDAWKSALLSAIRDPLVLLQFLGLDSEEYRSQVSLNNEFSMLVPLSFASSMKKGDWNDPLLKQVLPLSGEKLSNLGFITDPVGDLESEISSGVLQKYQGRVLLITTGACAVHCRYCFRQHFPYVDSLPDKGKWQKTLSRIEEDSSLNEVILSGGDPLMLRDERLGEMCTDLSNIAHIKTIRFHSRVPIILPERVNSYFISGLSELIRQGTKVVMVIHCNHANELSDSVGSALKRLSDVGVVLLNQSVLLKGINDSVQTLVDLSHQLFDFGVLPYYLHKLDKVQGAVHFEVSNDQVVLLQSQLKEALSGYLVPKFVKEVSGERSKQAIVKCK